MNNKPQPKVSVIRGISKAQLVKMAMKNYVGTTRELQESQYGRYTKVELALLVQRRAYYAIRGI